MSSHDKDHDFKFIEKDYDDNGTYFIGKCICGWETRASYLTTVARELEDHYDPMDC